MAAKEESGSEVKINRVNFQVEGWGTNKGGYKGTLDYEIGTDSISIELNHEMCKVILHNSHEELLKVIHAQTANLVAQVIACKDPISKSDKEIEAEKEAKEAKEKADESSS